MLIFAAGCQVSNENGPIKDEIKTVQESNQEQNIIAELKQTTDDIGLRDAALELREDMGVQSIKAEAVFQAVNVVYGNLYDKGHPLYFPIVFKCSIACDRYTVFQILIALIMRFKTLARCN